MNDFVSVLGILCTIGLPITGAFFVAYRNNQAKHAEKMAMIERGIIEEDLPKIKNRGESLRKGLLMVGLAVGGLIGFWITENVEFTRHAYWLIIGLCTLLFGGIALCASYFILYGLQKADEQEINKNKELR